MEQGAEEEINRLKETLAATSHKMEQIKEDFADHADKLQYAEKLLNKPKTDCEKGSLVMNNDILCVCTRTCSSRS